MSLGRKPSEVSAQRSGTRAARLWCRAARAQLCGAPTPTEPRNVAEPSQETHGCRRGQDTQSRTTTQCQLRNVCGAGQGTLAGTLAPQAPCACFLPAGHTHLRHSDPWSPAPGKVPARCPSRGHGRGSGQRCGSPPGTRTRHTHTAHGRGAAWGEGRGRHSPLITSATRVPAPSRLMTAKHLEGCRAGWPETGGERRRLTTPRFRDENFKGPRPCDSDAGPNRAGARTRSVYTRGCLCAKPRTRRAAAPARGRRAASQTKELRDGQEERCLPGQGPARTS